MSIQLGLDIACQLVITNCFNCHEADQGGLATSKPIQATRRYG